jgi:hypothetical protein
MKNVLVRHHVSVPWNTNLYVDSIIKHMLINVVLIVIIPKLVVKETAHVKKE